MTKHPNPAPDSDELILVDADDRVVGHLDKERCHDGDGALHRAFSVFLFDDAGRLLIQRRSAAKRLWPLFWSNSCCSHPRRGEETAAAALRRIDEELGVRTALRFLYRFEYRAQFRDRGSEHELCSVFVGSLGSGSAVHANPDEIDDWRWITGAELEDDLAANPAGYTPWFKLEWPRVREDRG